MKRLAIALPLLLAACGDGGDDAAGERKTAAGEVLGGTVSDAMLPLDTVRSQGVPLRERPATGAATPAAGATRETQQPAVAPKAADQSAPQESAATPD